MQYYLSRNNHVTGPYNLEALLRHGILPTDLIKEESGVQWRAPETFVEFKNNVSKPKYKITADKEVIEVKNDTYKNKTTASETSANSPFKRMPSVTMKKKSNEDDSSQLEMRKDNTRIVKPAIINTNDIAEKRQKVEPKKRVSPTPIIKPARRANNTNAFKEIFAPLLIIGGIGFVVWWGYKKFSTSDIPTKDTLQAITADSLTQKPLVDSSIKEVVVAPIVKKHVVDSTAYYARRDSIALIEKARKDSLAIITKANAVSDSAAEIGVVENITTDKIEKPIIEYKKQANIVAPTTIAKQEDKKPTTKKSKSISDYVSLTINKIPDKEVQGIKLNVKNVSNQPLNIAIIDVSYTDASGKIIRGETLQAENIAAGKTASVNVPNDKNAANISYKVSLISGDSIYLMRK